jgi:uncharacterized protein YdbL (DUF1318 family)
MMKLRKWFTSFNSALWITALLILTGCAVITVNVYFPEKDINQAYSTLEDELLKSGKKAAPAPETPAKPADPANKQSSLPLLYQLIPAANAQDLRKEDEEGLSADLVQKIKANPDVVQAYKNMGERMDEIDKLRTDGTLGEGNNGLVLLRVDADALEKKTIKLIRDENKDRETIMNGMAKAMREVRNLPENDENKKTTQKQATEQFAKLRVQKAKTGWWLQDADGKWYQKKEAK